MAAVFDGGMVVESAKADGRLVRCLARTKVTGQNEAGNRKPWAHELRVRILSAVVVATVSLAALWSGGWVFAALVATIGVLVAVEWSFMTRRDMGVDLALVIKGGSIVLASLLCAVALPALALLAIVTAAILAAVLAYGSRPFMAALGALYAGLPVVALLWLRGSDEAGLWGALLIILVVIATDTGAYFTGRTIGGPRLAPRISPGKTWSGLVGGLVAAVLTAAVFGATALGGVKLHLVALGAILALVSQFGDLAESALKRAHGVKDSGNLIPGHGGIMDRIDGLVMAVLAAAAYAMATNIHAPAAALLGLP